MHGTRVYRDSRNGGAHERQQFGERRLPGQVHDRGFCQPADRVSQRRISIRANIDTRESEFSVNGIDECCNVLSGSLAVGLQSA